MEGAVDMKSIAEPDPGEPGTSSRSASRAARKAAPARTLARYSPEVLRELPEERYLRVDVNGCLAGSLLAIPDAPRELAAGWAYMHGFFDHPDELNHVSVSGDRASIMVESGEDLDRRRLEAVGWLESPPLASREPSNSEPFCIESAQLMDLIAATWQTFKRDGGAEGYLHAAAASAGEVQCVARDRTMDMAVAKILGWAVLADKLPRMPVMLVRGIVGRKVVEAAASVGVSLIVTSAIPTADAFRAAMGLSLSIVGIAMSKSMGLLVDSGHIVENRLA